MPVPEELDLEAFPGHADKQLLPLRSGQRMLLDVVLVHPCDRGDGKHSHLSILLRLVLSHFRGAPGRKGDVNQGRVHAGHVCGGWNHQQFPLPHRGGARSDAEPR